MFICWDGRHFYILHSSVLHFTFICFTFQVLIPVFTFLYLQKKLCPPLKWAFFGSNHQSHFAYSVCKRMLMYSEISRAVLEGMNGNAYEPAAVRKYSVAKSDFCWNID